MRDRQTENLYNQFLDLWDMADALIEEAYFLSRRIDDTDKKVQLHQESDTIMKLIKEIAVEFGELGF